MEQKADYDYDEPFDLMQWVADHADELVPPVANKQVYADSRMIVMMVGGGNVRTDYHEDPREEFFYQIRGDMTLKIRQPDGSNPRDLLIAEGNVYLLRPHVRHSPQRPDVDSVGLVVEYQREPGELDGFEWYCDNCDERIHRIEIQLEQIDRDLPPLFEEFYASEAARTCDNCGTLHPTPD